MVEESFAAASRSAVWLSRRWNKFETPEPSTRAAAQRADRAEGREREVTCFELLNDRDPGWSQSTGYSARPFGRSSNLRGL